MNIMLDGCDCTGKTTIAKLLVKELPLIYIKCSNPWYKSQALRQYTFYADLIITFRNLIFDRFILSEKVYSYLKRGYINEHIPPIEHAIRNSILLIHVTADIDTIKSRFDGKFITKSEIRPIVNDFHKEFNLSPIVNKITIDTTRTTPEENVRQIRRYMDDKKLRYH
jgi:thymidylate kinase